MTPAEPSSTKVESTPDIGLSASGLPYLTLHTIGGSLILTFRLLPPVQRTTTPPTHNPFLVLDIALQDREVSIPLNAAHYTDLLSFFLSSLEAMTHTVPGRLSPKGLQITRRFRPVTISLLERRGLSLPPGLRDTLLRFITLGGIPCAGTRIRLYGKKTRSSDKSSKSSGHKKKGRNLTSGGSRLPVKNEDHDG